MLGHLRQCVRATELYGASARFLAPLLPLQAQSERWSSLGVRFFSSEPPKREKITVELREEDLDESFVKGWGKGGQKINKVRNCVLLKHIPTGLHVRCQETRSLDGNRRIARRLLLQKIDDQVNGELSKRNTKISKLRKKKANRRSKSKQKYKALDEESEEGDDEDSTDDEEEEEDEEDDDDEDAVDIVDIDVDEHSFRPKKKRN
ncbi:hypothetical protein Poli38472_011910 [Pythium oligandrum]|uniref:Prokaryotic-type class I peptide chain release factors domain-containing protein n=1 Tax=Pythium oligandrum TaxID=41045 RepID=A0A8K1FG44_PYTOL|nr:hypothetical protein Poli38472_011910 [Pythium oligandrum]|eukprot:TMW58322.1 hypothetical protein Poli38472_011910 [Pythium oligandrum]